MEYPIHEIIDEVQASLKTHMRLIIQAAPGAGKSTILPLELMNEKWLQGKKMIILEPRRLAARSIAHRMAELLGESVGQRVGYRIRFETAISRETCIEVVTEAVLIRMIQDDSALDGVGMIILDEFHERSLNADLALALSLQVQQLLRDDLRILIMSATLDGESLSKILQGAPVISSKGRMFPVEQIYCDFRQDESVIKKTLEVIRRAVRETEGDMLVFLPGAGEIKRLASELELINSLKVFELYGELPFEKQKAAIEKGGPGERKIVLATNIAETSLTIDGISVVIDSGLKRVPVFDPRSGLTRLETVRITLDSADQRAGRAGRLGPGTCYRLWSKASHSMLQAFRKPEVLVADLASLALELLQWGVSDPGELTWVTPPPEGAFRQALQLLELLDATAGGRITQKGKDMSRVPTHPRLAHMLLSASNERIQNLACDTAALLEERDPMPNQSVDFTLRVSLLRSYRRGERVNADRASMDRIERLASSWRKYFKLKVDNGSFEDSEIGQLLVAAYPERVARQEEKHSPRYKLANGRVALVDKHDPIIQFDWIVAPLVDAGKLQGKIFQAAPIDYRKLTNLETVHAVAWDEQRARVLAARELRYSGLVVDRRLEASVNEDEKNKLLCKKIREVGLRILSWDDRIDQLRFRVLSLKAWRENESWPDLGDLQLLNSLEDWLVPFATNLTKLTEVQAINFEHALLSLVPWELQQKLNSLAPERISVPSGSAIKLLYFADGRPPELAVRLQELFGLTETPTINEGRNKVLLHLLSPGFKPMQVTQDLRNFWTTTYFEVRKELRTRYPKHSWPEDPLTATAVRGAKKTKS